jgi:mannonate dehydratase
VAPARAPDDGQAGPLHRAVRNFGIQEARAFTPAEQEVFPGCAELKDGYYSANDKPGPGINLDEKLAAQFPITDDPPFVFRWGNVRKKDGSLVEP